MILKYFPIFILLWGFVQSEFVEIVLESLEDFERYGFSCRADNSESCTLKSVSKPSDLPPYFPQRFRNMSWDEEDGRVVLYAEGTGPLETRFQLSTNPDLLPQAKVLMAKSAKFYTESYQGFGIWKGYEPQQWWYPGHDPDFTGEWISAENGPIDSFGDMVSISLINNGRNEFSVFTSIRLYLDPVPLKLDEIKASEDFARLGFTFNTPDAVVKSVPSGYELPDYFPEEFRALEVNEGESLMWIEVDETLPTRRHNFRYYPRFPGYENTDRPYPAGVLITMWGRSLPRFSSGIGFGPHINWVGDRGLYSNFSFQYGSDGWGVSDNRMKYLYYFVDYEGVGLFAYNNHVDTFSVFKKIEFSYFYWETESEVTTTEAGTTEGITPPPTTTTTLSPTTVGSTSTTAATSTSTRGVDTTTEKLQSTTTEATAMTPTPEQSPITDRTTTGVVTTTEESSASLTVVDVGVILSVAVLVISQQCYT